MGPFIITTDPRFIPLIMLPEVEAVLWRDPETTTIQSAIDDFDHTKMRRLLKPERCEADRIAHHVDGGRILITADEEENMFPELSPVWEKREALTDTFNNALHTNKVGAMPMWVMGPQQFYMDRIWHKDWCAGAHKAKEIFATVAHVHKGTQAIPTADAGRQVPCPNGVGYRQQFFYPRTLKNMLRPDTHDMLVFKSACTVHRGPYVEKGTRWNSFFMAGSVAARTREYGGIQAVRDLASTYEYTP